MSRIRTIKPEYFLDDEIAQLHPLTRILFTGLWCLADKAGRLEDKPLKIKVQILPYDKHDVNAELDVLHDKGFILRYEVEGKKYIQIRTFTKHQRLHHTEKESDIPPYNGEITVKQPLDVGENSVGKEGKGKECSRNKSNVNKTSIPADFKISDRVRKWAEVKKLNHLDEHLEAFRAKCMANAYKYADWDAAFMEAVRGDWARIAHDNEVKEKDKW